MRPNMRQNLRPRGSKHESQNGAEIAAGNCGQEEAEMRPIIAQRLRPRGSKNDVKNGPEIVAKWKQK